MKISRILYPVHSLGPGERVCLWTQGCSKNCKGCISPEMQPFCGTEVDEEKLAKMLAAACCNHGELTISGGDPFEQPEALFSLLTHARGSFSDILVYTGYELDELKALGDAALKSLELIDVLIDGRYVEELNFPDCVLKGSENQIIHFFNNTLRAKYEDYCSKGRTVEYFSHGKETILTGILNKEKGYD